MQLEVSLFVTNETAGGLIGSTYASGTANSFTAQTSELARLPPCAFVTAVAAPAGTAEGVKFQVQNFGKVAATIATGSLAGYIETGWVRQLLLPRQLGEFSLKRGDHLLIVPYTPMPPVFQAKKHFFQSINWGADGVHLKWAALAGISRYRVHKLIVLQKGSDPWHLHQKWHCDTMATEFLDSDYKLEAFTGYSADTIYSVSALPYPDFPGAPTPGITFGMIDKGNDGWIDASIHMPPEWI